MIYAPAGLGWALVTSLGNELVAKNNIDDPVRYIGEQLSQALAAKYGIKVSPGSITRLDGVPGADLVLDSETTWWGIAYYRDSVKYQVFYHGRLRFIDANGGSLMAEGTCASTPEETPSSPTYGELLANGAERLKKVLRDAADICIGEFTTKVFQW